MPQCISVPEMAQFIETTGLTYTWVNPWLILHAAVGDIYWLAGAMEFCIGTGVVA